MTCGQILSSLANLKYVLFSSLVYGQCIVFCLFTAYCTESVIFAVLAIALDHLNFALTI